jgi:hypothetical protein
MEVVLSGGQRRRLALVEKKFSTALAACPIYACTIFHIGKVLPWN